MYNKRNFKEVIIMILDSHFDYINIVALMMIYQYENKKSISLDTIKKFREKLIELVLQDYKERGNDGFLLERDFWYGDVTFEKIDFNEKLNKFLEKYRDYFHIENNNIVINDDVRYDDIEKLQIEIGKNEEISCRFYNCFDHGEELFEILNIHRIEELLKQYSKVEKELSVLYEKLNTEEETDELQDQINKLLNVRALFYMKVEMLPWEKQEAFHNRTWKLDGVADNRVEYDTSPLDVKLLMESDYYDEEDFSPEMDDRIYDVYQYAIFGKKKNILYGEKINNDLDHIRLFSNFSKNNEEEFILNNYIDSYYFDDYVNQNNEKKSDNHIMIFDPSDEELIYYLNYINNIDNYMEMFGVDNSLIETKNRLLYTLDTPDKKLFKKANFNEQLKLSKEAEIDEDFMEFFQGEYGFFIEEIFIKPTDEYTLRKLFLIGTYYDLTKDEDVIEIFEQFKDDDRYDLFYEIAINNCNSKNNDFCKNTSQYFKKYNRNNKDRK